MHRGYNLYKNSILLTSIIEGGSDMLKKILVAILTITVLLGLAVPVAAAETFTSSNGVISIELPNESWREITDLANWISLSDGGNLVTINHYSNGEKLPEIAVADDHYVNVYQAVFSTHNEVFIITGYTVDAQKIPEICQMIMSVKVLQYDTKLAVNKTSISSGEFSIRPMNETMYTTDGINVRIGCSTSEQIIGGLAKDTAVKVVGAVQRNGKDLGWYQIEFGSGTGYVAAEFLTSTAPQQETPSNGGFTGRAKTIYAADGSAVTVYEAYDGSWYDGNGKEYVWFSTYEFSSEDGYTYTVNQPVDQQSGATPVGDSFTVYWLTGNTETLTLYSDGAYYSSSYIQYWDNGNGTYSGADGTTLYAEEVPLSNEDVVPVTSEGSGRPSVITYTEDGIYDAEGNQYYEQSDGTYIDDYGAVYDSLY